MVGPEVKSKIKIIGNLKNPIIIIGQNPGHNMDGSHTGRVWEGNRSANLLLEALEDRQNLILTNICNYTIIDDDRLLEGMNDLIRLILVFKPKKIICLGDFAYKYSEEIRMNGGEIYQRYRKFYKFNHPSYIARFNKDKEKWINDLREIIDG